MQAPNQPNAGQTPAKQQAAVSKNELLGYIDTVSFAKKYEQAVKQNNSIAARAVVLDYFVAIAQTFFCNFSQKNYKKRSNFLHRTYYFGMALDSELQMQFSNPDKNGLFSLRLCYLDISKNNPEVVFPFAPFDLADIPNGGAKFTQFLIDRTHKEKPIDFGQPFLSEKICKFLIRFLADTNEFSNQ